MKLFLAAFDSPYVMTIPRELLPGSTYLLTHTCPEQIFRLRPAPEVNQIFLYCLAEAAAYTGVQVHAFCVMSNHWHCVLTDPDARVPEFAARVHRHVALCMKRLLFGRIENFFSVSRYNLVRLEQAADVLEKIVYVLANPVRAVAVARAREWPGLNSVRYAFGDTLRVDRPGVFFRHVDSALPDQATLRLRRPPGFASSTHGAFTTRVRKKLARTERSHQAAARAAGRRFLGRRACLAISPTHRPKRQHAENTLVPRIAAGARDVRTAALERFAAFLEAYREARLRWKQGARDTLFPAGTYWLRVHARVRCRAPT